MLQSLFDSTVPAQALTIHWSNCCTRENIGRGKLANLVNFELFVKMFFTNIHRYTENVFDICTDCSLFNIFFLANSFYLYGLKFPPIKIFPCMVMLNEFSILPIKFSNVGTSLCAKENFHVLTKKHNKNFQQIFPFVNKAWQNILVLNYFHTTVFHWSQRDCMVLVVITVATKWDIKVLKS